MTELNQVFKCNVCGNIVETVRPGQGHLVCCSQPMKLTMAKDQETRGENIPAVEPGQNGITVTVGTVLRPLEDKQYIEWILLVSNDKVYRKYLRSDNEPAGMGKIRKVSTYSLVN